VQSRQLKTSPLPLLGAFGDILPFPHVRLSAVSCSASDHVDVTYVRRRGSANACSPFGSFLLYVDPRSSLPSVHILFDRESSTVADVERPTMRDHTWLSGRCMGSRSHGTRFRRSDSACTETRPQIRPFLNPLYPHLLRDSIPMIALWSITPWLVDLVLFLRVLKVYPLERGRRMTYAAIITFPVAVKVARAVTGAIYISHFVPEARHASLSMFGAPSVIGWAKSPLPKIGWILQLADNRFAKCSSVTFDSHAVD
jgi:hypothetical protein